MCGIFSKDEFDWELFIFLVRFIFCMCYNVNRVVYIFGLLVKEFFIDVIFIFLIIGVFSILC